MSDEELTQETTTEGTEPKIDITKAKRVVELSKDNKRILITLFEGGQISSCVEDERRKQCEICQGDDELCNQWVDHLKERGYEATEIEMAELGLEESLPGFPKESSEAADVYHVKPASINIIEEPEEE